MSGSSRAEEPKQVLAWDKKMLVRKQLELLRFGDWTCSRAENSESEEITVYKMTDSVEDVMIVLGITILRWNSRGMWDDRKTPRTR